MIINEKDYIKIINTTRLICCCDLCGENFERTYKNIKKSREKWNSLDLCFSCTCKKSISKKPQCSKEYWTSEEKRNSQREIILNSEKYQKSRLVLSEKFKGEGNPRYGKKVTEETRKKMSKSRTGKIGENATAWKGGKSSLTKRVKKIIHTRYNWYRRVYERDGFKCVICGSNKHIDAHHIKPIVTIIKELLNNCSVNFNNEGEKLEWLVNQEEIKDANLTNGQTLCRDCHKKAHRNWGSKINP